MAQWAAYAIHRPEHGLIILLSADQSPTMGNRIYAPHLRRRKKDKYTEVQEPMHGYPAQTGAEGQAGQRTAERMGEPEAGKIPDSGSGKLGGWLGKTKIVVRKRRVKTEVSPLGGQT